MQCHWIWNRLLVDVTSLFGFSWWYQWNYSICHSLMLLRWLATVVLVRWWILCLCARTFFALYLWRLLFGILMNMSNARALFGRSRRASAAMCQAIVVGRFVIFSITLWRAQCMTICLFIPRSLLLTFDLFSTLCWFRFDLDKQYAEWHKINAPESGTAEQKQSWSFNPCARNASAGWSIAGNV